jgi:hypothetical protein
MCAFETGGAALRGKHERHSGTIIRLAAVGHESPKRS